MSSDSDIAIIGNPLKERRRILRSALGVNCPNCNIKQPKRIPSILLPRQRCKVDGYRDPRPYSLVDDFDFENYTEPEDDDK